MKQTTRILCAVLAALVFAGSPAFAAEDTTDPVLTVFTLTSSATIDTGPSSVSFAWTATATDDLSGVSYISVNIYDTAGAALIGGGSVNAAAVGDLSLTDSGSTTLRRYTPYQTLEIWVTVADQVGNQVTYIANGSPDLCAVDTPCTVVNAAP